MSYVCVATIFSVLVPEGGKAVEKVDNLPVNEASEEDVYDIESLIAELKKLAPVNGRALLLFRDKCGCHVAKLEALGK